VRTTLSETYGITLPAVFIPQAAAFQEEMSQARAAYKAYLLANLVYYRPPGTIPSNDHSQANPYQPGQYLPEVYDFYNWMIRSPRFFTLADQFTSATNALYAAADQQAPAQVFFADLPTLIEEFVANATIEIALRLATSNIYYVADVVTSNADGEAVEALYNNLTSYAEEQGYDSLITYLVSQGQSTATINSALSRVDESRLYPVYLQSKPQQSMRLQLHTNVKSVQCVTLLGYQIRGWAEQRGEEPPRQAVIRVKNVEGTVASTDSALDGALAVVPLQASAVSHFDYNRGIACARTLPTLRTLDVSVTDRAGAPLHVDGLWFRVHYHC